VLVDTGAACTVVAMSVVHELGLRADWLNGEAGGAGGPLDQYMIHGANLRLGAFTPRGRSLVGLDFAQINAPLLAQGSAAVDVIVGVDVFDVHAAVIDYPSQLREREDGRRLQLGAHRHPVVAEEHARLLRHRIAGGQRSAVGARGDRERDEASGEAVREQAVHVHGMDPPPVRGQ
jgi:hypothetical protein